MAYTILAGDPRAVGTGNPPVDVNNLNDVLTGMGAVLNVLNTAYAGGADSTGVADSTAAFQACITAAVAAGAEMVIPPGTYNVNTGGLQITGPLKMRGLGAALSNKSGFFLTAAVTLNCNGNAGAANMFTFPYQGYLWGGLEIQGLNINYTGTGNVFHQVNFTDFVFRDMVITLTASASMAFFTSGTNSLLSGLFERMNIVTTASTRTNPMISVASSNSGAISNNTHFKCKFTNAGFDNTQYMCVYSCTTAGNGFHYADNFRECWFEHPYGGAYKSLSGMGITVDGCSVWDAFTNSGQATTVAAGSNGGTITGIAAWANPSAGVLAVASTTSFPPSGTLNVTTSGVLGVITYTGVTPTTFTGCAYVSGSGTVSTGAAVVFPTATAKSYYYFGAAPSNSGSTGTKITGSSRNRNGPNGTTCWDAEFEATSTQTQIEGYCVKPDTASTYTPAYFNLGGHADVALINNQSPQGASVNGNSDTVISNPSPSQVTISQGVVTPSQAPWVPSDSTYLAYNYDPMLITQNTALPTKGTPYLVRINVRAALSVTNVLCAVTAINNTPGASQNWAALATSAGALVGTTADQGANWGSLGVKTMALAGGPYVINPGFYWIVLLANGTTAPVFGYNANFRSDTANAGAGAATCRWGTTNQTLATTIATFTPGSNIINAVTIWAGLS